MCDGHTVTPPPIPFNWRHFNTFQPWNVSDIVIMPSPYKRVRHMLFQFIQGTQMLLHSKFDRHANGTPFKTLMVKALDLDRHNLDHKLSDYLRPQIRCCEKVSGFIFSSRGPSSISAINIPRRTTRWKIWWINHRIHSRNNLFRYDSFHFQKFIFISKRSEIEISIRWDYSFIFSNHSNLSQILTRS